MNLFDRNKTFWLLLFVLIIATFLRLYQIKSIPPGLYPDEAMNGNNALENLHNTTFKIFYPENNGREGLFIGIQTVILKLTGANEPWVLRLPSTVFGVLTVLGIYLLAAQLFSKNIGLLSAFFLATGFWHINFSRIGFRAILAPFLLIWALYLFVRALRATKPLLSILHSIFSGIIYGLGFYTYISYRATPFLFLLFLPFFRNQKKFWRIVAIFLIATFVAALPIGIYFLKNPADFLGRTSQVSVFSSQSPFKDLTINTIKTLGMFNFIGDYNWRHNVSGRPELFWPVGILFIIGILVAARQLFSSRNQRSIRSSDESPPASRSAGSPLRSETKPSGAPIASSSQEVVSNQNQPFPIILLFLWLILAALPVIISNEGLPHALRAIIMIPPVFMIAALGGSQLYKFIAKYLPASLLKTGAVVFFALLTLEAYNTYFVLWAKNPNTLGAFSANYVDIGREINALPPSIPKYVVVPTGGVMVRGIPMPAQTVMFMTDTFLPEYQQAKNIHYIVPEQEKDVPRGAMKFRL